MVDIVSPLTDIRHIGDISTDISDILSLRHEYVRQLITDGIITITYMRCCKNLADPFIKALARDLVRSTIAEMGL